MSGEHRRRERLREELVGYLGLSAYLYVCFLAVELYKASVLQAAGLHYAILGLAAGKALVIGKFVLLGEAAGAGQRLSSRNVLHRIVNRSLLLFVALVVLKSVEEAILGAIHGRSAATMLNELAAGALPELLASSFLLLLILVPWVFVTELDRVLGRGSVKAILMRRPDGEAGGWRNPEQRTDKAKDEKGHRMNSKLLMGTLLAAAVAFGFAMPSSAQQSNVGVAGTADKARLERSHPSKPVYSPYAGRNFPTRPYFGDTHLHTGFSMDAGAFGARLTPNDAYRFARGEEIQSNTGQPVKLSRPLDFLVVADHSDGMGFFPLLMSGDPELLATPQGRRWYEEIRGGKGAAAAMDIIVSFGKGQLPKGFPVPGTRAYRGAWEQTIKAAETHNDPGRFTAFIGYEWTSNTGGNNLHRNVVFRGNGTQAAMVEPFTTQAPLGSDDPVDLWKWMAATEQRTGSEVLAIAHNGNLSNGRMFPMVEAFGKAVDADYARTRARWEPLYEVTQTKGTGEAHPFLSPNDELANFELWDKGNLDGTVPKTKDMLEYEYARAAYRNGLLLEARLGTNPFKFGLIGSSDAHTGLAAMEEDNFFGKTAPQEPSPERLTKAFIKNDKTGVTVMDWEVGASGYAAVWAAENTREALFDAMKRRETYATTGSRLIVRFFGGFGFEPADAGHRLPAAVGYSKGVPMGGDLRSAPAGQSPSFLVAALKDPIGANLDRLQVIKGWVGKDGKTQERVYDVAVSGGRKIDADGRCRTPVGSTVDVANATWTNTIGAPELIAVWKDPEFDPRQRAFYYVRVLEIPTPRWTAYDANRFGTKALDGTRMTIQERAYTSPIWYTPG